MKGRTVVQFPSPPDLWSQVETWAEENRFTLDCQEERHRVYSKGHWLLMSPASVEIRQAGKMVTLEAWVKADLLLILRLFSGKKSETAIESGGITASIPRWGARRTVNKLLARFGQKPIK